MKGKSQTIVMAVMALALVLSLVAVVEPANEAEAGDLSWTPVVTSTIDIALNPMSDINDLVLSATFDTDSTMYASVNDPTGWLMGAWIGTSGVVRSSDGGVTWTACAEPQNPLGTPPVGPLTIALSPDDIDYLVATDGFTIWASADGGGTWSNYGTAVVIGGANSVITSIDVGPVTGGIHPMVIGMNSTAGVHANGVYIFGCGSPPMLAWVPQELAEDIWAVAFSPNYASDFTIVAVGSPAGATNVHLGDGSLSIGPPPGNWDAVAIFEAGWPQVLYGQVSTGACIALPADFNGLLGLMQVAFVGTRGAALAANNDVWRVRNVGSLTLGSGLTGVASLDMVGNIGGSAALMVGDTAPSAMAPYANLTYTFDPWDAFPWWTGVNKPPTGAGGNAIVALAPDYLTSGEAFCATGCALFDESALSKTTNSGLTWNQISLIDTDINVGIADMAPSPDYASDSTLFLATCSVTTPWDSLWKSTTGGTICERIDVMNTTNDAAIVRVSPDYGTDAIIYWAETGPGANRIRLSNDDGAFFYTKTIGWAAGGINDMVVEGGNTVYLASGTSVGKSTDWGSTWLIMGSTSGPARHMVQDPSTGDLAISGDGVIYLCTDTTTMTINPVGTIPGAGVPSIQWLAFSDDYATDNTLYIADQGAAGGIWKLVVGGPPPFQIHALPAPGNATGIVIGEAGVLYCADAAPGAGVWRSLDPGAAVPEFTQLTAGLGSLPVPPIFVLLRLATGASNILWAVDIANEPVPSWVTNTVMTYTDMPPAPPPTPTPQPPVGGTIIPTDKPGLVTPWITAAAVILAAGVSLGIWRRRAQRASD